MELSNLKKDIHNLTSMLNQAVYMHQNGLLNEAQNLYQKILNKVPNHPEVTNLFGLLLHKKGFFDEAIEYFSKAIQLMPDRADFFYNLANAQRTVGLKEKALKNYKRAITLNSSYLSAFLTLGSLFEEQGRVDDAIKCYNKALSIDTNEATIWFLAGNVYLQKKKYSKAIEHFGKAIERDPKYSPAYNGMGVAFKEINQHEKAIWAYRKAVNIVPNNAQIYCNLGYSFHQLGRYVEAINSYRQALKIEPLQLMALQNLGNAYLKIENIEAAISTYQKALKINNRLYEIHNNLGMAYRQLGNIEDSLNCFFKALELKPEYEKALKNTGLALMDQGKFQEAKNSFKDLIKYHPKLENEIIKALAAPIIYDSSQMIISFRKQFQNRLTQIQRRNGFLEDPFKQVGVVNFISGMHGCNEKSVREQIASIYLKFSPHLEWKSPHLNHSSTRKKIHIGFVSDFLHEHTIGRLYHGLIESLSKNKFHISIFRLNLKVDQITQRIDKCSDKTFYLPKELETARKVIAEQKLDVLFYPELGMEPFTYFLSFSRLAPVQCKRGFPITMGIPNIDYFISSKLVEPEDAENHYSEELILLKRTGYYYHRPEFPNKIFTRKELGVPENKRLYICPHNLFKVHPDFDMVIGKILRKDPDGILVLLKGKYQHWENLLFNRFRKTIPDVVNRINFIPSMPRKEFITLFLIADAVLDPIHVSGGNTSLECFSLGIPVITWPGLYLIGRWTYGFYRYMDILDCVADDLDHYVELAVRLANDKMWYLKMKNKIETHSKILFEDDLAVKEIEDFFEWAVNRAYKKF
jgi:predicted O-linked N-acetylglucosamine transferase (SPINDLY family)